MPLTGPEDPKGGGAAAGADAAQEAALGDATNREAVAREQAPYARSSSANVAISSRHALCSCRACVCSKAVTCAAIHQQAEQHQQARCVLGIIVLSLAVQPACPQPPRHNYGHTAIACHAGTTDVSFPTWHGSAATEPTQQQAGLAGDTLAAAAAQGSPNVTVQQGSAVPAAARARSTATEGAGAGAASKAADASFGDWAGQGPDGGINKTTGEQNQPTWADRPCQ